MSSKLPHQVIRLLSGLAATAACLFGVSAPAQAADGLSTYAVEGSIAPDGTLNVKATLTFEGAAPATVVQRLATAMGGPDDTEYRYAVTDVKAAVNGSPLALQTAQDGDYLVVTLPTQGVTAPVELDYAVRGAAVREQTGETTVSWRLLQGLSLPVRDFTAELTVPSMIKLVDCQAGPPATLGACTFYGGGTHDHPNPFFSDGPRGAGEVVNVVVRFDEGAVAPNADVRQLWTFSRAFSASPSAIGISIALLGLGALTLLLLHRRFGRDGQAANTEPIRVAEFHPVGPGQVEFRVLDGIRPGQVGTVVDERVDPVDMTATVLDLAIRGHLLIEELPRTSPHAPTDWRFTRRQGGDELEAFERTLLDAIAPAQGEPVTVSTLAQAVGGVIGQIQDELYDVVVTRGWFVRRPDQARNAWGRLGWLVLGAAVVLTVVLAAFTTFGLVGLALVIDALALLWIAQEMPARTPKGVGLLNGLALLRAQLYGQPTDQMPSGKELQELSEILPYAVVLGGVDRWLQALVSADTDDEPDSQDLDWYHAPEGWNLADLPGSLRNFVTTLQGTLFTR